MWRTGHADDEPPYRAWEALRSARSSAGALAVIGWPRLVPKFSLPRSLIIEPEKRPSASNQVGEPVAKTTLREMRAVLSVADTARYSRALVDPRPSSKGGCRRIAFLSCPCATIFGTGRQRAGLGSATLSWHTSPRPTSQADFAWHGQHPALRRTSRQARCDSFKGHARFRGSLILAVPALPHIPEAW